MQLVQWPLVLTQPSLFAGISATRVSAPVDSAESQRQRFVAAASPQPLRYGSLSWAPLWRAPTLSIWAGAPGRLCDSAIAGQWCSGLGSVGRLGLFQGLPMPLNWLCVGFGGALGWLYCGFTLALLSHSPPNPLPITWLYPGFDVALGGFARFFEVRNSRLDVPYLVFTIRILNTTPLSRLLRGGLGALWYHPGHTLYP